VDRSVLRDSATAESSEAATSGRQEFKKLRFQMIVNTGWGPAILRPKTGSFCHGVVAAITAQEPPRRSTPTLHPESITGGATLAPWFPVRLAGAEVTEAFWAKAAVLS
jgi:hypothetical protein